MSIEDDINSFNQSQSRPISRDINQDIDSFTQPTESPEEIPTTFLDKLDAINTGTHRGVTRFTHKLLSLIPNDKLRNRIQTVDREVEGGYQEAAKKAPGYALGGELLGEALITLPVGGAYGKLAQGASKVGALAPAGLKTLGKYGTAMLGGAGLLAAQETQRYDPNNPDQLLNLDAADAAAGNPLSYAMPAIGTKLGSWAEKSRAYQQARETLPSILPRDMMDKGIGRQTMQKVLDSVPMITGYGKRARQLEGIGGDIENVIHKMSGLPEALDSKDLIKYAGAKLQHGIIKMEAGTREMWSKPFLKKPIQDSDGLKYLAIEAQDILNESGMLSSKNSKYISGLLKKSSLTVDDAKELQTLLSKRSSDAFKSVTRDANPLGHDQGSMLNDLKNNVLDKIQTSLSGDDLTDFNGAREYSANMFKMYRETPKLKKALTNEIAARNLVRKFMTDTEVESVKKGTVMGLIDNKGQQAVKAARIAKILESSTDGNDKVNLGTFIKNTSEATGTPELLGDTYKTVEGLNKYLGAISEASKTGGLGATALGMGSIGGIAGGALVGGLPGGALAGAAAITYPALSLIANHPVLKKTLGYMTKNMSNSAYQYMTNTVQKHLMRSGFIVDREGGISHRDEEGDLPDTIDISEDNKPYVSIPTRSPDGRSLSEDEAVNQYFKQGGF